ncbi:DUF1611 domain-containing protein [Alkalicaulis satelles]|uniref:DUF1611 domain-containing protein n=1 Tax=Alkalicaulis satelles TaxID=2609175 RepID=A0A5M6ZHR7_9PROT|nr:DUF1611 domain-containing protein [Alkalicaulis satelles]KAA5803635.1 DUF1611 domain-containing protein [Alkalicaulis satelles]
MIALPYLVFLGDADREVGVKTAQGVLYWRPDQVAGQYRLPGCELDLGIADMDYEAAVKAGARTVLIGIANRGGILPERWIEPLRLALEAGLDIASGLHQRLSSFAVLKETADRLGRQLHDVRHWSGPPIALGTGERRPGKRVLMVGTDCNIGKKYAALAVAREMAARGVKSTFRATGQTGLLIAGEGVAIDAIPADFVSGAVEMLCPANTEDHWDVIEGQASVLHPFFGQVTHGLVLGAQPDVLVLCHEAGRAHIRGLPHRPLPSLTETLEAHLAAARINNRDVRAAAVSVNTGALTPEAAEAALEAARAETGLPATDPIRHGAGAIVDAVLKAG